MLFRTLVNTIEDFVQLRQNSVAFYYTSRSNSWSHGSLYFADQRNYNAFQGPLADALARCTHVTQGQIPL